MANSILLSCFTHSPFPHSGPRDHFKINHLHAAFVSDSTIREMPLKAEGSAPKGHLRVQVPFNLLLSQPLEHLCIVKADSPAPGPYNIPKMGKGIVEAHCFNGSDLKVAHITSVYFSLARTESQSHFYCKGRIQESLAGHPCVQVKLC